MSSMLKERREVESQKTRNQKINRPHGLVGHWDQIGLCVGAFCVLELLPLDVALCLWMGFLSDVCGGMDGENQHNHVGSRFAMLVGPQTFFFGYLAVGIDEIFVVVCVRLFGASHEIIRRRLRSGGIGSSSAHAVFSIW